MQTSIRHNKPIALMVCWLSLMVAGFSACQPSVMNYTLTDRLPAISPDYTAITLPPNIAPLNFQIDEQGEDFVAKIWSANNDTLTVHCAGGKIQIDENRWKNIISNNKGMKLCIAVFALHNGRWTRFKTIENQIANEPIDSYMAYRLVEPLFETWDQMGIYQRCLENFDEKAVMANTMSDGNYMNCHAFNKNSSRTMMFHMRGRWAGTYIYREGKLEKVNTKTDQTISPGVYPSWHPNGRDIAFSVNHIAQTFHAFSFGLFHVIAMRIIFQNFSITQQGRGQALYSTMWGLGVASGSILAGRYWQILSGENIFIIAGLCTFFGLLFVRFLPEKVQENSIN